jgi:hypothetical protein
LLRQPLETSLGRVDGLPVFVQDEVLGGMLKGEF